MKPTTVKVAELATTAPLTMLGNVGCPFCGHTNLSLITPKASDQSWVLCETCAATGPVGPSATAEARWNARAFDSEIFITPQDAWKLLNTTPEIADESR